MATSSTLIPPPLDRATDGYHAGQPQMVLVGPPGTGKTRAVLDVWLVPAIEDGPAAEVLGTSFTKAAANEMRERLQAATGLPEETLKDVCKTIHSECWRLSRAAGDKRNIYKMATPSAAEKDGWEALAKPRSKPVDEALRRWSLARHLYHDECKTVEVEALLARLPPDSRFPDHELASHIRAYEADKDAVGQIDFTDMLLNAKDIVAPRRRLLVVDEAQDLSPLQISIIERWAETTDQVVWVGDPDQGIFAFAGADGRHLTGLLRSGIVARRLEHSWRVPAWPHKLARDVILRNSGRVDAPYTPSEREGIVNMVWSPLHGARLAEDLCYSAACCESAFVLARTAAALAPYASALSDRGIPFTNERGGSPMANASLVTLLQSIWALQAWRRISPEAARAFVNALPGKGKFKAFTGTKKAAVAAVKKYAADGRFVGRGELLDAGVSVGEILEGDTEAALRRLNLWDACGPLMRIVKRFGPEALKATPKITLTTVHASKGREADAVVVNMFVPWPVVNEIRTSATGAEGERRALYVALTRTRNHLCIVQTDRDNWGEMLGLVV